MMFLRKKKKKHFHSIYCAWEGSRRWPNKSLAPTHFGNLDAVPGSWLWASPARAAAAIWGVNQHMESFPVCSSLSVTLHFKINKSFLK